MQHLLILLYSVRIPSFNFWSSLAVCIQVQVWSRTGVSHFGEVLLQPVAQPADTVVCRVCAQQTYLQGSGGGREQVDACSLGSLFLHLGSETCNEKFIFQFRSYFWLKIRKKMLSGESNVHLYLRNSLAVELLCVLYSSCQSEGFALSFSAWGEILQLRL